MEAGIFLAKLMTGDVKLWATFASVVTTQFGSDNTAEVEVVKSPEGDLFEVVVQPAGRRGGITVSNFST